jgi:hypothetical protein
MVMAVQNSTRKWVFIGVGVIAAAALVVFFQNYPPQPKDAAATIGAAQRYHATQITGADVKVSQDELTTWIQSDTFDRIVKDPQARKLFTDAAVISMFNDAARKLDAAGKLDAARRLDAAGKLDAARRLDAAGKLEASHKLEDSARKLDADAAIRAQALANAAIRDALKNDAFCKALMDGALRDALLSQARKAEGARAE